MDVTLHTPRGTAISHRTTGAVVRVIGERETGLAVALGSRPDAEGVILPAGLGMWQVAAEQSEAQAA
jgi:hypothetical protein